MAHNTLQRLQTSRQVRTQASSSLLESRVPCWLFATPGQCQRRSCGHPAAGFWVGGLRGWSDSIWGNQLKTGPCSSAEQNTAEDGCASSQVCWLHIGKDSMAAFIEMKQMVHHAVYIPVWYIFFMVYIHSSTSPNSYLYRSETTCENRMRYRKVSRDHSALKSRNNESHVPVSHIALLCLNSQDVLLDKLGQFKVRCHKQTSLLYCLLFL